MENELISVIIPIYNIEKYIDDCISSIINQSYKNIDILLIDDGSTDSCFEKCDQWEKKDNRIRVIHKENGGLSDARNVGIKAAKGKYIFLIDGDDIAHKDMLKVLYENMVKYDADISIGNLKTVSEDAKDICNEKMIDTNSVEIYNEDNKFDSLFYNDVIRFIVACNKLFKREIFDTICFPKGRYYEDSFIAHHIIDKVSKMVYTDEVLYYYRLRKGSITSKYDIKRLDDLDAMKDRMNLFNEKYKNTKYADLSIILYYDMLIRVYCNFIYYKKNLKDYKSVVKKLKSEYDINYKRIIKISNSKWKRMKYWLFKYFPNIYYFVIYRYRIIRKGATNW